MTWKQVELDFQTASSTANRRVGQSLNTELLKSIIGINLYKTEFISKYWKLLSSKIVTNPWVSQSRRDFEISSKKGLFGYAKGLK